MRPVLDKDSKPESQWKARTRATSGDDKVTDWASFNGVCQFLPPALHLTQTPKTNELAGTPFMQGY